MSDSEPGSGGAAPAFNSQPSATPSTLSDASTPSQQLGLPSSDSNLASTATPPPDAASATSTASTSSSSSSTPGATIASTSLTSRLLGVPDTLKVIVHFRAVGDAPQLKKSKFMLSASYRFIVLIDFLRKHLHYKPTDTLVRARTQRSSTTPTRTVDCRLISAACWCVPLCARIVSVLQRVVQSESGRADPRPVPLLPAQQRARHQLRHAGRLGLASAAGRDDAC